MAEAKLHYLGVADDKKYFYDLRETVLAKDGKTKVKNPSYAQIVWKIPDIRQSITAEPGYKILSSDYSQVEVRIMAFLSQDPGLIRAINSGQDIHCYFSVDIYGQEREFDYPIINAATKAEGCEMHPHEELTFLRSGVKTTVFGTPYGASPAKIAEMTGMTEPEAADFQNRYFRKYPGLKRWLDAQGQQALRHGFTASPRGRKRFYILPNQDDPEREKILSQIRRWAGNMPIQAGNVDMLKPAMSLIYQAFRARGWTYEDARILFVVHDEIVCTCRDALVKDVQEIVASSMRKAFYGVVDSGMLSGFEQKNASKQAIIGSLDTSVVKVGEVWRK
jgi:DNA polymerase I